MTDTLRVVASAVTTSDGRPWLPFDLSAGQYRSLFEILEADNPYEAVEFLSSADEQIPLEQFEAGLSASLGSWASVFSRFAMRLPITPRPMKPRFAMNNPKY